MTSLIFWVKVKYFDSLHYRKSGGYYFSTYVESNNVSLIYVLEKVGKTDNLNNNFLGQGLLCLILYDLGLRISNFLPFYLIEIIHRLYPFKVKVLK